LRSGTLLGVPYQVQPVWLLVFAIAIVTLISSVGGGVIEALPAAGVLLVGGLVVTFFVACIVAHELSHALMRRRLETLRTDSLPVVDPDEPSRLYGIMTREKALERLRMRHHLAQARGDSASLGQRG
jgi:hypothetical protein